MPAEELRRKAAARPMAEGGVQPRGGGAVRAAGRQQS